MKPIDVKPNKFKVGGNVWISKYKNVFAKDYGPKILWLKKLQIQLHGHMLLMILMVKKLLERFTKTNCNKQIKKI